MTPLRKILYYFVAVIAFLMLIQLPYAFAFTNTISSPQTIDTALKEGGVYKSFVDLTLENAQKNGDDTAKQLLSDQKFKDAITSSIQESDIQAASTSVITGVYAWLEGETPRPTFTIDLSAPAKRATEQISAYAAERSSKLPACTIQQLQTINPRTIDPLTIPCLPPGFTSSQIGEQFAAEAQQEVDLLKDPVITSEELFKDGNISSDDYTVLPAAYKSIQNTKWYFLAFALLLPLLLIFARRDRLAGVRTVSKLLIGAGALLALALLSFNVQKSNIPMDDKSAEIAFKTLVSLLEHTLPTVQWYAVGYIALGIAGLIITSRLRPKTDETSQPEAPQTATQSSDTIA